MKYVTRSIKACSVQELVDISKALFDNSIPYYLEFDSMTVEKLNGYEAPEEETYMTTSEDEALYARIVAKISEDEDICLFRKLRNEDLVHMIN